MMTASAKGNTMNLFKLSTVRNKMLLGTAAIALISAILAAVLIGLASINAARLTIEEQVRNELVSVREVKTTQVTSYFEGAKAEIQVLAQSPDVVNAMRTLPSAFFKFREQNSKTPADVGPHYDGDFTAEFKKRNAGAAPDTAPYLAKLGSDAASLQAAYIADNRNKLGEKFKLSDAADGSDYSKVHAQFHPRTPTAVVEKFHYYDFFLIDADSGHVVYTYFKELDFATSLRSGPWADTGLARAFKDALAADGDAPVILTDYAPYIPSYNDQAAFISTPIFDAGKKIGVLVLQLPIDEINAVMTYKGQWEKSGLGKSGETYLVGADLKSRSIARPLVENKAEYLKEIRAAGVDAKLAAAIEARGTNIGLQSVSTKAVTEALAGKDGFVRDIDYHNFAVLAAYAPLNILGLKWAIVAEIEEAEAFAPISDLRQSIALWGLGITLAVLLLAALIGRALVRTVTVPLNVLGDTVQRLSAGDSSARSPLKSTDEFGQFSGAFNQLLDERVATLAQAEADNKRNQAAILRLMNELGGLADGDLTTRASVTEDITGAIADSVNYTVEELGNVVKRINATSELVAQSTVGAQRGAQQLLSSARSQSTQIKSATAAALEVATAIGKVSDSATQAVSVARLSLEAAQQGGVAVQNSINGMNEIRENIQDTAKRIKRLGESSQEISEIVELIADITDQTNILALNAAIQAASAGQAGRGFSVVADEVQRLADRSAEATRHIAALVKTIQGDTQEAIAAMERSTQGVVQGTKAVDAAGHALTEIQQRTHEVTDLIDAVASSSYVQSELTKEVAQSIRETLDMTQRAMDDTTSTAATINELAVVSAELKNSVARFKVA